VETSGSSETSVLFCHTSRRDIPESVLLFSKFCSLVVIPRELIRITDTEVLSGSLTVPITRHHLELLSGSLTVPITRHHLERLSGSLTVPITRYHLQLLSGSLTVPIELRAFVWKPHSTNRA
jgi:hypothetical protein